MKMKKVIAIALSMALVVGSISFSNASAEKTEAAEGWTLEWSDEFDGTSLNTSTWNYEIGNGDWGWGNGEKEYYTNRKENLEVSNGTMKIKALKENYGGQNYTSARITTKNKKNFKYGKIEARMKLPSFSGAWPAFWMLGSSGGWPGCGEIDIMEAINSENWSYGYLHWYVESADYNGQGDTGGSASGKTPAGYQRTDWHTYGIIWDEKSISWYIDDVVYQTKDISADHMSEFRKNQYIIFNLAIGGQWPGYNIDDSAFPNNSVMEVDYVRVYQKQEEPTTKYDGPMVTVAQDSVAEYTGNWTTFFGGSWCGTQGSVEPTDKFSDGYTMNLTSIGDGGNGDAIWSAQCNLENIKYYAGATYTYKCTILSDVDKTIFVKVADGNEEVLGGGLVDVKAGVPYQYETTITIPKDYEDTVSLKFGMGKAQGENIESNSAATIKISDLSFVTTTEIPDPNYVPPTTTTQNPTTVTQDSTTAVQNPIIADQETTTVKKVDVTKGNTSVVKKPARAKIKKIIKKKKSLKIKIKKVKKAKGYQIRYSTNRKFKKYRNKTTKRLNYTLKKLKSKKKYYVKVRAYVLKSNGKKLYGRFSKVKKVKTK